MLRSTLRYLTRGLTRRPSPARKAHSARLSLEELECRLTPTVSLSIVNGVLTAQCDSAANTVTVDHVVQAGKGFADINGHFFADAKYSSIQVIGGAGGTVTNIHGNVKPLTVLGDSAKDVVNLGDATNHVQGIQGTVRLEDEHGFSSVVNINDQGDSAVRTVTLSTVPRTGDTSLGQVLGLGAAAIQWDYHDTHAVNLKLGTGAKQVNVNGTGVTTNVFNSAAATINVGSNGSVAGIQGALTLENLAGALDTVNINSQKDTARVLLDTQAGGDSSLGLGSFILQGVSADIFWDNADTSAVNVHEGSTSVFVAKTGVTTNILSNASATIDVGFGSLAGIQGALNVENETGTTKDVVIIDDQNDTNLRTATVSTITRSGDSSLGAVNGLGAAQITWDYADTGFAQLFFGHGTGTVNVLGTGTTTDIFNNGNATINVGTTSPTVPGSAALIQGDLNLSNGFGTVDTVNIDGRNDAAPQTVAVSTIAPSAGNDPLGAVDGLLGGARITWDYLGTSSVTLQLGAGASTVNVLGTGVPTTIFNSAAAGINVGSGGSVAGIQGDLHLENEAGAQDVVTILDQNDTALRTVTVSTIARTGDTSLGALNGLGNAPITWDYNDTLVATLHLGIGASQVNVLGTGTTTNLFNSANATINVGNSGSLAGIQGALHLENLGGSDVLAINDLADTTSPSATLDTLAGNVGRVSGLSAPITFRNDEVSQDFLDLGPATSTVHVDAIGTSTTLFDSANATVVVGNGSLAGIQGSLTLDNDNAKDSILVDDSQDPTGQTFNLITVPGFEVSTGHAFGQLFGTAITVSIQWDNSDTNSVTIVGGNGDNVDNIFETGVATTISNNGSSLINVGAGGSLAGIQGALNVENPSGPATLAILDQADTTSPSVTLDTFSGNVGRITGLSAPITYQLTNDPSSQLILDLGPATTTVNVSATFTNTTINNSANATVFVGDGTLTAIQGNLNLNNVNGSDSIIVDDQEDQDPNGQRFDLDIFSGTGTQGATTFGQISGTAAAGLINWDNATTSGVTILAGNFGNLFNIRQTRVPITINGGTGANTFNVGQVALVNGALGQSILAPLTLHGGGNAATTMDLIDVFDFNPEVFNFDIPQAGTGTLTLGSNPSFLLAFDGMNFLVELEPNGITGFTVNDPSGTVLVQA
jgi:hypothetical protein